MYKMLIIFVFIGLLLSIRWHLNVFKANRYFNDGLELITSGYYDLGFEYYEKALDHTVIL